MIDCVKRRVSQKNPPGGASVLPVLVVYSIDESLRRRCETYCLCMFFNYMVINIEVSNGKEITSYDCL